MNLYFDVRHQHIERTDHERPVADSRNFLHAHFNFLTDEWNGITKTACFWRGDEAYNVILDDDDNALVPWEVLSEGCFEVSCYGGDLITNDRAIVRITKSGYAEGKTPENPTPSVYSTILNKLSNLDQRLDTKENTSNKENEINDSNINDSDKYASIPAICKWIEEKIDGKNLINFDFVEQFKLKYPVSSPASPGVAGSNNAIYTYDSNHLEIRHPENEEYTGVSITGVLAPPQFNLKTSAIYELDSSKVIRIDCYNARIIYMLLDENKRTVGGNSTGSRVYLATGPSTFTLSPSEANVKYIQISVFAVNDLQANRYATYSNVRINDKNDGSIRARLDELVKI